MIYFLTLVYTACTGKHLPDDDRTGPSPDTSACDGAPISRSALTRTDGTGAPYMTLTASTDTGQVCTLTTSDPWFSAELHASTDCASPLTLPHTMAAGTTAVVCFSLTDSVAPGWVAQVEMITSPDHLESFPVEW